MSEVRGPVMVVGCGLLGTSLGLALRGHGVEMWLTDRNPEHVRTATGLGAGAPAPAEGTPALVVVAVPPDHLGPEILAALRTWPDAVVTDVGSVKGAPLSHAEAEEPRMLGRYVGGHPMAGSERSGPLAASAALFDGRPWAVTPHATARDASVDAVVALAEATGGVVVRLTPAEHDLAVARTSHLPHLMAVLVAGRLADAPEGHLALSGQGVRDVTRVAAGDPTLWQQIISANAAAVLGLLEEVGARLDVLRDAVATGARDPLAALLGEGVAGTRAIPGKHGGPARPMRSVYVVVPDHPGELARLFADSGSIGVNIEDVRIDHDPGRPVGQVELLVEDQRADELSEALAERGWTVQR